MSLKVCLLVAIFGFIVGTISANVVNGPDNEVIRQTRGWFDNIKNSVNNIKDKVTGSTSDVVNNAKDAVNNAKDAVNNAKDSVDKVVDQAQGAVDKITEETKEAIKQATGLVDALKNLNICSCNAGVCQCCADLKLTKNKVCFALTFKPEVFEIEYGLLLNDKPLMKGSVSGRNPGALCAPLPQFPAVSFCFRPYDLTLSKEGFHACFQVEVKTLSKVIASVAFNCFRFKGNTISLLPPTQPTDQGYVNLNVTKIVSPILDVTKPITLPVSIPKLPSFGLFN